MMSLPPVMDRPLFLLDYDGTLAPIVSDPEKAFPHPRVPALLDRLASLHPVVVVTGRRLQDLAKLLPCRLRAIGLHGVEEGMIGDEIATGDTGLLAELKTMYDAVPVYPGILVEDKGPTFAVHYRQSPDEGAAVRRLEAWAEMLPDGFDMIHGKKVFEVRPKGKNKGVAVLKIAQEHPDRVPIYLGDDRTDEDAFLALPPEAVTVKVGEGETAARYRLPDVDAVVRYLNRYVNE
jgi:trehalose 6-phosphate phosphatase